jgi:acetylornithine deacetylase/succinyl-diaminopimelate desuccinylase-like protein
MKRLLLLLLLLQPAASLLAQSSGDITADELRNHIRFLASDSLQGRKTAEPGNEAACNYIASAFQSYGLAPAGDNGSYLQRFEVLTDLKAGSGNALSATVTGRATAYEPEKDFRPVAISADGSVRGTLVFAGYGISSDSLQFDEYAGLDVKGKIVMVLRFTPDMGKSDSKFTGWEALYRKAMTARDKGAVGVIVVTGPADEESAQLIPLRLERRNQDVGIPVVNVSSTAAQALLSAAGAADSLRVLQQRIYDTKKPASFALGNVEVSMTTKLLKIMSPTANVAGLLKGSGPELVVIGAHFDHLGLGGPGSGSLKPDTSAVHHGADDNASGTAGLLELAQYFSSQKETHRRSILFLAFTGEEMGLLGSAYYVGHPEMPLEATAAMINLDMIGRMKDSTVIVEGVGTAAEFEKILRDADADSSFHLKLKAGGFGPSDHASFTGKKVPVLFFFTNLHEDYHRPSDTWDKIHYSEEQRLLAYVAKVAKAVTDAPARPAFVEVKESAPAMGADRRDVKVSLGVMPDYAEEVVGLKITGTRPGSPADKAGLKGGDIIIKFGEKTIKNIYDYMYALGEYKPGDSVTMVVKRGAEEVTLTALLEARKQ